MKKIISVLLALILVCSLVSVVSADTSGARLDLTPSSVSVAQGSVVTVTVSLTGAEVAKSGGLQFAYDSSVFETVSGEWKLTGAMLKDFNASKSAAAIAFGSATDINGDIFALKLKARDTAAIGSTTITVTPALKNGSKDIDCAVGSTTVAIKCKTHTAGAAVKENFVNANCGFDGSYDEVVYCTVCGDEISRETKTIPATGKHVTGGWVIDKKPTLTETGLKHKVCSVCGKTVMTETIPVVDPNAPRVEVESKRVGLGRSVDVNISIKNNPGIAAMKLLVSYDEGLTLDKVTFGDIGGQSITSPKLTSPVILNWFNGDGNLAATNTVYATLTFTADADTVTEFKNIAIDFDPEDVVDINENEVEFVSIDGGIDVLKYIPGDINDDGKVNNKDIIRLFHYLSGITDEVNEAATDVNIDGAVNNKDITTLFKYLSGWDIKIY